MFISMHKTERTFLFQFPTILLMIFVALESAVPFIVACQRVNKFLEQIVIANILTVSRHLDAHFHPQFNTNEEVFRWFQANEQISPKSRLIGKTFINSYIMITKCHHMPLLNVKLQCSFVNWKCDYLNKILTLIFLYALHVIFMQSVSSPYLERSTA